MNLVLASGSPRRRELLRQLEIPFETVPSQVDERLPRDGEDPVAFATSLALEKAMAVARQRPQEAVLGADTVVSVDGSILGKPADQADAVRMLEQLKAKEHVVATGICLICRGSVYSESATARVRMRPYSTAEIEDYIASGEPMDKAGAYAIQGLGGDLVETVQGCHDTVVGLPLTLVEDLLLRCGVIEPGTETRRCRNAHTS